MSGSDDRRFRWLGEDESREADGSAVVAADLSYADTAPGEDPEFATEQSTSNDAVYGELSDDAGESAVDSAAQTAWVSDHGTQDVQQSDESTGVESMVDSAADDATAGEPDGSNVDGPAVEASDEAAPGLFATEAVGADLVGAAGEYQAEESDGPGAADSGVSGVPGEQGAGEGVEPPVAEVAEPPDEPDDDDAGIAAEYDAAEYEAADMESGVATDADAAGEELTVAEDIDAAGDGLAVVAGDGLAVVEEAEAAGDESAGEVDAAIGVDVAASDVDDDEAGASDPAAVRVLALRQRLAELDNLPTAEHAERYEALHAELTGALAQIDRAPDGGA